MFTQTSEYEAAFGVQPPVSADLARIGDAGHIEAPSRTIGDAFRHAVKRIAARFAQWRKVRQTSRILSTLDNRMLKDIGLSRSEFSAFGGAGDSRWQAIQRLR